MPRGRGRRRASSQSSSPGFKSSSVQGRSVATAEPGGSDIPLRRSSRISRLSATRENPSLGDSAFEGSQNIYRQHRGRARAAGTERGPQRGTQANRADPVDDSTGYSVAESQQQAALLESMQSPPQERLPLPQIDGEIAQELGPYEMEIVVQPPAEIQPGVTLDPPIVARLRARDGAEEVPDISGIWASVFLTSEDGVEVLAPPSRDLLRGALVNSVQQVVDEEGEKGYVSFPGLTISEPGTYRLRICLIRMETRQNVSSVPYESGINFQTVHSRVVRVQATTPPNR